MANNKKVKRGFIHKLTTNVEETATTKITTCHITKHNYNNTSSSSRSHYYSSTTICNMKQRNSNNKTRKSKYNNSVNNSFSSNICCNNKVYSNKGCTNNNTSISGSSICWPSLNLFYFSCKSPNSIITFITTTLAKCISNLQNLCYCWWNWWWWSLQQYKIKNKMLYNSYASSSSSLSSSSKDWQKRAALKTSSNNNRSSGGSSSIKFCTSLKLYFFLWLFLSILAPCISLTMTEVRIPKHIMRYETATLGCKYDLDGESLYSVKWYKDGFEFYRYVPRDMPPGQVFPLPGVDVDLQNSTDNVVVLNRVTLQSTGRYRCEVSGEAPSFQTVSGHEDMIVVVTPLKGPQITGGQPRYSIGEKVSVNCTSAPSKPICHLSWLINGVHANRSYLRYYEPKIVGREGLEVATLGLEFRVRG